MNNPITCVLGNEQYEVINVNQRKLLLIYGSTAHTSFTIVPGWYTGNERYENGHLVAVDVEIINPVEQMNVEDKLKSHLQTKGVDNARISFWGSGGVSENTAEEPKSRKPPTVLVVDDDPSIREIIKSYLERQGFRVDTASNSSEARRSIMEKDLPNLMLLDIMMPGGTGWQLLKELEKDPRVSQIPVVAISALEKPSEPSEEYDSKMLYDYLVKPFSMAELSRTVRKFASA